MKIENLFGADHKRLITEQRQIEDWLRQFDTDTIDQNGSLVKNKKDDKFTQSEAYVASQALDRISIEEFFSDSGRNSSIGAIAANMMNFAGDDGKLSFDELKAGAEKLRLKHYGFPESGEPIIRPERHKELP